MGFFKLMTAATLATATLLAMPSTALAQTVSQDQSMNASARVVCTGTYSQSCTAEASASGQQSQRVVYRADGTPVVIHDVINTGLDTATLATVAGTLVTGATAVVIKLKNRAI
jgi:hypothetical protein